MNKSTQQSFKLENRQFDIIVPNKKLIIDFNGLYWHGENVQSDKFYHYKRWELCQKYNYKLFTIWEDDWYNKKDLVKSMIKNQLGLNSKRIFARNCEIKEVSYIKAKEFLINNHIQGNCQSSYRIGLYFENQLISLMTFGKRKISKQLNYELLRFCNLQDTTVTGGASKLFKYFLNSQKHIDKIISYANLDISNGNLYEILKFTKISHTGLNYWWVKGKTKFNRYEFMKHKLKVVDKNLTANEIMRNNGFYKLYGIGNIKYEYVK